jgi:hypothetical protein
MKNLQQEPREPLSAPTFESTPWLAAERTVEEPLRAPEPALRLVQNEHVIDLQESESIRRVR